MSSLERAIKNLKHEIIMLHGKSVVYVKLEDVLKEITAFKNETLIVPQEQLEKKLDEGVHWRVWEFIRKLRAKCAEKE